MHYGCNNMKKRSQAESIRKHCVLLLCCAVFGYYAKLLLHYASFVIDDLQSTVRSISELIDLQLTNQITAFVTTRYVLEIRCDIIIMHTQYYRKLTPLPLMYMYNAASYIGTCRYP